MGLTAETVQVYAGAAQTESFQRRITETVTDYLFDQGFLPAFQQEEADRVIVIAPPGEGPWITVYDSNTGESESMAKKLSEAVQSAAVSLMVFDSDDVFVRLYDRGALLDRHEQSCGARKWKADPGRWSPVADADKQAELRHALESDPLFAEEQLIRLAVALGMDAQQCVTPSYHLEELTDDLEGDGFVPLFFRSSRNQSERRLS